MINGCAADAAGLELSADARPVSWWRFRPSYTYFRLNARVTSEEPGFFDVRDLESESPRHRFSVHNAFDVSRRLKLDLLVRSVGALSSHDVARYCVADVRAAWKWNRQLVVSVVGRDLLERTHAEYSSFLVGSLPTAVEASAYAMIEWRP